MNLNKLIEGYAAIKSPLSPELLRAGAVISALSRISNHYRIKIKDGRTVDTFCNFFFLFMGSSGIGKDIARNVYSDLRSYQEFVAIEQKDCEKCEKAAIEKLKEYYYKMYLAEDEEFSLENFNDNKTDRNKAVTYARGKVRHIQPIMNESTRPNLEAVGLALVKYPRGGLTITNGEFLMWMKHKKSEAFEMFSFLADGFDNGVINVKGTVANNRQADEAVINGLPLNVIFMSSQELMSDNMINGNLKDFFLTAGARRFVTASEVELEEPIYSREDADKMFEQLKSEANEAVKSFRESCERFAEEGIVLSDEAAQSFFEHKESMKQYVKDNEKLPEIIKIELRGAPWRALKMAGIMALLNHPTNNKIESADYKEAVILNNKFVKSFRKIVDKNWLDEDEAFIDFIKKHPGCTKGDLYKLDVFSKNKIYRKQKYDELMEICGEKLKTEDLTIETEVAHDGKSVKHSIVERDFYKEVYDSLEDKEIRSVKEGATLLKKCPVCGDESLSSHCVDNEASIWRFVCVNEECETYKKIKQIFL